MVVINNSADAKTIKTTRFQENIKSFSTGNDVLTGKSVDVKNELSLDGKSVLILELK
jgi:predicted GTPase